MNGVTLTNLKICWQKFCNSGEMETFPYAWEFWLSIWAVQCSDCWSWWRCWLGLEWMGRCGLEEEEHSESIPSSSIFTWDVRPGCIFKAEGILPPDLYKNIKSEIARRILSKNKEKWQTVNMAYTEIDYLRDQASNRDDENEALNPRVRVPTKQPTRDSNALVLTNQSVITHR